MSERNSEEVDKVRKMMETLEEEFPDVGTEEVFIEFNEYDLNRAEIEIYWPGR